MERAGGQQAGGLVDSGQRGCRLTNLRLIKRGRDADWKLGTICHMLRTGLVPHNPGLRLVGLDCNLTLKNQPCGQSWDSSWKKWKQFWSHYHSNVWMRGWRPHRSVSVKAMASELLVTPRAMTSDLIARNGRQVEQLQTQQTTQQRLNEYTN